MPIQVQQFEIPDDDGGTDATVRHMLALIHAGAASAEVRALAAAICERLEVRDPATIALALREWCAQRWCFVDDPEAGELLYAADTQLWLIQQRGCMHADCDDAAILFGALGAACGLPVRIICVAFLTTDAPYSHTWAEIGVPSETGQAWVEGDVTRPMQVIPINRISRVGVWNDQGNFSEATVRLNSYRPEFDARQYVSPVRSLSGERTAQLVRRARTAQLGFTIPVIGVNTSDIGAGVGILSSIFGGGPAHAEAQSVITKWYNWGLSRAPDDQGLHHWIDQYNHKGAAGAYADFLTAPESVEKNMAQRMAQYQQLGYGGPLDDPGYANAQVTPPLDQTAEDFFGVQIGSTTPMPVKTGTPAITSTRTTVRPAGAALPPTLAPAMPWGKIALAAGAVAVVGGVVLIATRRRGGRR